MKKLIISVFLSSLFLSNVIILPEMGGVISGALSNKRMYTSYKANFAQKIKKCVSGFMSGCKKQWQARPKTTLFAITTISLLIAGTGYYYFNYYKNNQPKNNKEKIDNNQSLTGHQKHFHDFIKVIDTLKTKKISTQSIEKILTNIDSQCNQGTLLSQYTVDQRFWKTGDAKDVALKQFLLENYGLESAAADAQGEKVMADSLRALALALELFAQEVPYQKIAEEKIEKKEEVKNENKQSQDLSKESNSNLYYLGTSNNFERFDEIVEELEKRIKKNDKDEDFVYWLGTLYQRHYEADKKKNKDSKDEAIKYFKTIPDTSPDYGLALSRLIELGVDIIDMIKNFDLSKRMISDLYDLGKLNNFKQFDIVVEELKKRIADNKDEKAVYWLGTLYQSHYEADEKKNKDSKDEAIKYFKTIPDTSPNYGLALSRLIELGVDIIDMIKNFDLSKIRISDLYDLGKLNNFKQFDIVVEELKKRIADNKDEKAVYWLGTLYQRHYEANKKKNEASKDEAIKYFKMIPNDSYALKRLGELGVDMIKNVDLSKEINSDLYDLGKLNNFKHFGVVVEELKKRINDENAMYWLGTLYQRHYEADKSTNKDSKDKAIKYFKTIPDTYKHYIYAQQAMGLLSTE